MAKVNIELLKRLRTRFLRMRHKQHFNMGDVAMCSAGHTLDLEGYKYVARDDQWLRPSGRPLRLDPLIEAQKLLGLSYEQAQDYYSHGSSRNGLFMRFNLRQPKQAAVVIQDLIEKAQQ